MWLPPQAMLILFQLATLDNWVDCFFATLDITGHDSQPRENASWANAIFFIVFICISAHLIIKTFIAVFTEQVGRQQPYRQAEPCKKCVTCATCATLINAKLQNCLSCS